MGALEQILTFYRNGVSYPVAGRDELVRKIPGPNGERLIAVTRNNDKLEILRVNPARAAN